jgi:hypothetical protein
VPYHWDPSAAQGQRFSDAALIHMAWYPLKNFSEDHYRIILAHINKLKRPSGTIRYDDNVYLNAGYFFEEAEELPIEMRSEETQAWSIHGADLKRAAEVRDSAYLKKIFGKNLEAQWSLADIIKIEMLGKMIEKFPDSSHRQEYYDEMNEAALRMFGFVTGASRNSPNSESDNGPYAIDGIRVPSWKFSEAAIPVQNYYAFSPYTPLFWPTAEAAIAIQRLWKTKLYCSAPFKLRAQ